MSATPLVHASGLGKSFRIGGGLFGRGAATIRAVDDVDLAITQGETVGIVGESGSGKSTLGRLMLRLIEPTSGTIAFEGRDLAALDRRALRALRRRMQIIFQDPYASLNPRMRVGAIVGEGLLIHRTVPGSEIKQRVLALMDRVGLGASAYDRYPHEFSGGQRQRIGIARALAVEPSFIVADEPVSALDVSIQAQILNLLLSLRAEREIAFAFISHDLRVVEHVSHRVAVMYFGRIVELASAQDLYRTPLHPSTRTLMSAVPRIGRHAGAPARIPVIGDVPSPVNPPPGCPFHPRCALAEPRCKVERPLLEDKGGDHRAACHVV